MRKSSIFSGAFVALLISPGALAQSSGELEIGKIIIGNKTPQAIQCYENARNGDADFDAIVPCDRAIDEEAQSDRGKAIVYANRGVIHFNIGVYEEAVADFTASLDLGINFRAKLLSNRGLAYETMGMEHLARADYQAALAFRSDYTLAVERLEQLELPLYERSKLPKKITAETPRSTAEI